ncbi:hypothetical protein DFJ58DRAFT_729989 [Suillus subalutaceus]|uniref:uncharacterized protein n=1 Tax=Suillus subalutaceus TaxID=48586 RepID=UPI001B86366A|nr:uncharacterized protein DFJ58DRAFT_729989 [Suillus subalutaceus]KAG1848087.1 hypothetical protein DFJ58DRAFT_729989 [Suillus subalutaceus]
MAELPADTSALMSAILEGILYGFSILLFIGTIWFLTYKRRMQDVNRPIAVVAVLLLLVSTVHMVVGIVRVENGLVKYRDTWPGGPVAFFEDVTEETYVIKHGLYVFQTVLADAVMVYRCYVLWKSVRVIILPILLWCSIIVTGVRAVYGNSQAASDPGNVFATDVDKWIMAFVVSTLVTNLDYWCIAVWKIERRVFKLRTSKGTVMAIVRALVDAAALYSVMLFSFLFCFITANNGESVLSDIVVPIISITFYMVLIRITINFRHRPSTATTRRTIEEMEQGNVRQYPMMPVEVHISQFTQDDSASSYNVGNKDRPSTGIAQKS